jgi:hypothetical protein
MRYILIYIILLFLPNYSYGQSLEDQKIIIQKSIDIKDLQLYLDTVVDGKSPLIIYNNGVIPLNLELTKFDIPVIFMLKEELFFFNKKSYLEFDLFEIGSEKSKVVFNYSVEGLEITLLFIKSNDNWILKSKNISERKE